MRATKVVFLHIPKCAGSSVRDAFRDNLDSSRFYWMLRKSTPNIEQFLSGKYWDDISKYDLIGGHFRFRQSQHIKGNKIIFSIIRDPVQRVLSHFDFYNRDTPVHITQEIAEAVKLPFLEALDKSPKLTRSLTNAQCKFLSNTQTFEETLATILRHPFVIDTVANAQRVMDAMCETLGVETVKLPRKNAGPDGYAQDWATDEVIERIREMTQEDQKLFDLFNSP